MASAEKNDVDISKLFQYSDKFVLTGKGNKTHTVYIRLVGDAELKSSKSFCNKKKCRTSS